MTRAPKPHHISTPAVRLLWSGVFLLLSACDGVQSTLSPDGPAASSIATLWWVMLVISTVVSLVVIAMAVYAVVRPRRPSGTPPPLRLSPEAAERKRKRTGGPGRPPEPDAPPRTVSDDEPLEVVLDTAETDRTMVRWVLIAGVVIPTIILTGTFLYTLGVLGELSAQEEPDLTIQVVGWQWWWEVRYLDEAGRVLFETANEIHIPAGQRVAIQLEAADVIHSFWVPQLAGKLDMIPGKTTQLWLEADEPGVYRGQCAEYCAGAHALMAMLMIVQPEEEYRAWAQAQALPQAPPRDSLAAFGEEVFLQTSCRACHAVRGTPAVGNIGPDLTHVASRRTLAAATIPNTRGHMGGWLANPQEIKPAVHMPAVPLGNEEFLAVLHYMMTLE
jgi:cytochrome c oxidase subunit II